MTARNLCYSCVALGLFVGCSTLSPVELPPPDPSLGTHWLRFVHMSDTQLVDEESPARALRAEWLVSAAWRWQEAYGVATLDATLRRINQVHDAGKRVGAPISFVVVTGDLADGAAFNELRYFIDTMDGKIVETDSGALDGTLRTLDPADNPKLPYEAEGLAADIPWYTVLGNHDALSVGNFPIDTRANNPLLYTSPLLRPVAAVLGLHQIDRGLNAFVPIMGKSPAVILGDGPPVVPGRNSLNIAALKAGPIPPDNRRRFLSLRDFIEEHFNSDSIPRGHGFTEENLANGLARYSVRPRADVPLRLIVMNTVPPRVPRGYPAFYGVMTEEQFENFVKPEVLAARARGEFVILASHHTSPEFDIPFPGRKVGTRAFQSFLASQPNVIAHICGHTHRNRITAIQGTYPYYEIETGAIIDSPQEVRVIDIYFDGAQGVIRLASTMIGHAQSPTRLSAESLRRAGMTPDQQEGLAAKLASDMVYQSLFSEFQPMLGDDKSLMVPREMRPSALERMGNPEDRDIVISLRRDFAARGANAVVFP